MADIGSILQCLQSRFYNLEQVNLKMKCMVFWGKHTSCTYCELTFELLSEHFSISPRWGAADAEIKVPSGENTKLKCSPFKAWSRSVYSHTSYAYCQGFLPSLFLPFRSIHVHFFQNLSRLFSVFAVASTGSCIGPQNKLGHFAGFRLPC